MESTGRRHRGQSGGYPPRRQKVWSEAEVDPLVESGLRAAFDWLYQLRPEQCSDGVQPAPVSLSGDARALWAAYVNDRGLEQFGRSDDALIAANAKLEAYAARFTLVVHQLRHAAQEDGVEPFRADARSVTAGIELAAWFSREAERVYALLGEKLAREVIELARANGGQVTARLLMQRKRSAVATAAAARGLLKTLADADPGTLEWHTPPKRGRPSETFVLNADADVEDLDERLAVQGFGGG